MPPRHAAIPAFVAAVWGVNFVVIRLGLDAFPPLLFAALRFTLVALPAVAFVARPPIPLRWVLAVGAFLSAGQFGLLFVAMDIGMPAGLASLVMQLQVLFTIGLGIAVLGERPSRLQVAGALVALCGIGVIAADREGQVPLMALLLSIGAAASWGVGNVCARCAQAPDPVALLVWSSLVPPIPLITLSLFFEGPDRIAAAVGAIDAAAVGALLYLVVVSTFVGFGFWAWLLRRHPLPRVAPVTLLVPVVGIAAAWAALGEAPSPAEVLGTGIVLAGLGLTLALAGRLGRLGPSVRPAMATDPIARKP